MIESDKYENAKKYFEQSGLPKYMEDFYYERILSLYTPEEAKKETLEFFGE